MSVTEAPQRDANGRFLPGCSGNPAGKRPGTRNRATVLREALKDGEDGAVARVIIDKALAGNAVAARFVIGRLVPRPRGEAIALDLPEGADAGDVLAAHRATVAAMASGEITPEEALTVTKVLDFRLKAVLAARKEEERARPRPAQKAPSPLAGEGRGEGAGAGSDETRQQPPHPPIAIAMGPSLSRSRGDLWSPLSRQAWRSHAESEGRGTDRARCGNEIAYDLLHSTCISRPVGWPGLLAA